MTTANIINTIFLGNGWRGPGTSRDGGGLGLGGGEAGWLEAGGATGPEAAGKEELCIILVFHDL